MKFDQLRYFLETAKQGHVGKAANVLAISPSAISHSIAALEEELGRELFVKKGKRIVLTDHGKLLMDRGRNLLKDMEAVVDEVASDKVELQGHYRLAATHLLSSRFLTPAWTRLQREHPRLTAELYSFRSAQVVAGLASGEYDFGLCFNPQPHPQVDAAPIYPGTMVIVVRKDHPLLKQNTKSSVRKLSQHPAALPKAFQGVDNCESHPIFRKFGIRPDIRLMFDSYEVAIEHIASSDAWGLMPCWMARSYRGRLDTITPKGWKAPVHAVALWPKNRSLTKTLQRLIGNIREEFNSLPGL